MHAEGSPSPPVTGSSATPWAVTGLVVCLAVLGLCWTLASPVGSSPDDDFHLASIWCSRTAPAATCVEQPSSRAGFRPVLVPEAVGPSAMCFRFEAKSAGACPLSSDTTTLVATRANSGQYPGGYYDLMGVLVGERPVRSALAMRIVNWSLSLLLVALAAVVATPSLRRAYLTGVVATAVPLGVFLLASTNPSGLAFAAVGAVWCAASTLFIAETRRDRVTSAAVAAVAAAAAVSTRADAGAFVVVALVVAAMTGRVWRRIDRRSLPLAVAALAASGLAAIAAASLVDLGRGFDVTVQRPLGQVIWQNAINLPSLWAGALGTWGLGWLDTQLPAVVGTGGIAVVAYLLITGTRDMDRAKAASIAAVAAALIGYPMILLAASQSQVGENFQPRYLLPLLPIAVAVMVRPTTAAVDALVERRPLVVLGATLAVTHAVALHAHIRRYVTGEDVEVFDLGTAVEWWWGGPLSPRVVWAAGAASFAGALALTGRWILPDRPGPVGS